ncbi:MAG TPA: hypothetical protein VEK34_03880 [Methylocella sp.]|nr:hypothetical protein [Methylocella sp.]
MYRAYGGLLISKATRDRNVTYFNMSPSAHTLPTIEAQGFKRYCEGEIIAVPALSRRVSRANVEEFKTDCYYGPALSKEERELLISHVAYGCIALIVRRGDKISPFLFLHRRSFRRLLPTLQLIYCRDLQEFSEYAGRIGRALLRRGVLFFRLDAPGPLPGVSGIYLAGHGLRYFRGPHPPHIGDFTFTETIFLGW